MGKRHLPIAKWKKHNFNDDNDLDDIEIEQDAPKKKKRKRRSEKWQDRFYLLVYQLARDGRTHAEIAQSLGVDENTLKHWRYNNPTLQDSYDQGVAKNSQTFQEYVYDRLPPNLQETWDKLQSFERKENNPVRRIMALMNKQGRTARQHLFLQALISKNFSPTQALRSLGMSYQQLMTWTRTDPHFVELMNEIEWHRKNFYEDALAGLVKEGNPSAVIFANRTKNKDRGYGTKVEVEHSGTVNHNHQMVDLDSIGLPFELKRQILDYIEAHQMKALPAPEDKKFGKMEEAIDVPYEVLEEENDAA